MEEAIKQLSKFDANVLLGTFTTLFMATVVPTVVDCFKKWEFRSWKVAKKVEGESFYGIILMFAFVGSILNAYFFTVLNVLLSIPFILQIIILILVELFSLRFIHKRKFVKLRIRFGYNRIKTLLINIPIILLYSSVFLIIKERINNLMLIIVMFIVFISEICGLIIFQGRYTRYEYSYAKLRFKNADPLLKVSVDKIFEKGKWIIIEQNNCKIKILHDDLLQIEYFGRPKYVLRKDSLRIKSPILKKVLDKLEDLLDITRHLSKWKIVKLQKNKQKL